MARIGIRSAADQLMVLFERHRAAPVAAEPAPRQHRETKTEHDQRDRKPEPRQAAYVKAALQRAAEDMWDAEKNAAKDEGDEVTCPRRNTFAARDFFGAGRSHDPVAEPREPQRRNDREVEIFHC